MTPRRKLWIIVFTTILVLAVAVYAVLHTLVSQAAWQQDTQSAARLVAQSAAWISTESERLRQKLQEWAASSSETIQRDLAPLLDSENLTFAVVQDASGEVVTHAATTIPITAVLDDLITTNAVFVTTDIPDATLLSGAMMSREGLFLVARIVTAPDRIVTWGRALETAALAQTLGVRDTSVQIYPTGSPALPTLALADSLNAASEVVQPSRASGQLAGYLPLHDLYGLPAAYLEVAPELPFVPQAEHLLLRMALVLGGAALIGGIALAVVVQRWIVRPLERSRITIVADPGVLEPPPYDDSADFASLRPAPPEQA